MRGFRTGAAVVGGVVAVRRTGRRSGVTDAELATVPPGDDLVPDARVVIDRATTLSAPPERVWPWSVQLGTGRAGWYLPALLETVVSRARRGLRSVEPPWHRFAPGDVIPDRGGAGATFEVVTVVPPRALVHPARCATGRAANRWALVPRPVPGGTRLHLRLRISALGRRLPALVATVGGMFDEATVRPMFAGPAERLR